MSPKIFLGAGLAASGKLRHCGARRGFGRLTSGVGVDLGIEHEHVDVASAGQYVIEAAVADVIGPTVSADDPNAFLDQQVGDGQQLLGVHGIQAVQFFFQQVDALALFVDVGFVFLWCSEDRGREFFADRSRHAPDQFLRELGLLIDGKPEAQTELRIVFEKRVRPGGTAAGCVFRPGRGGQVAAVNRRASGSVGNDGPVAEQLRHQLEIWSFAATRAGAGELEQRFLNLLLADVGDLNVAAVQFRDLEEEVPVVALGHAQRRLRHHVDRLEPCFGLVLDRTNLDADAATGAIFRRHLNRVLEALPFFVAGLGGFERLRSALQFFRVVNLDADDRMRTNHGALSALNADLRIPGRDFERQVALLPFRGSGGKSAVDWKCAHRQFVATSRIDHAQHVALEFGR